VRWRPCPRSLPRRRQHAARDGPGTKVLRRHQPAQLRTSGGSNTLQQTYSDCVAGAVGKLAVGATGCKGSPNVVPTATACWPMAVWPTARPWACAARTVRRASNARLVITDRMATRSLGRLAFLRIAGFMRLPAERQPDYCANYDTNYGLQHLDHHLSASSPRDPRRRVLLACGDATRFTAKGLPWTGTLTSSIRAIARTAPSSARPRLRVSAEDTGCRSGCERRAGRGPCCRAFGAAETEALGFFTRFGRTSVLPSEV